MEPARPTQSQELFSRSSTPPGSQSLSQSYSNLRNPPSSSTHIDSLFNKLQSPSDSPHAIEDNNSTTTANREFQQHLESSSNAAQNPSSMLLGTEEQASPQNSTVSTTERHTALLSLLSPPSSNRGTNLPPIPQPQQIPTPPASSQRSGASPSHNDAKMLLDQLMGRSAQKSSLSDSASVVAPSPSWGPSYAPSASVASLIDPDYRNLDYRGPLYMSHEDHSQRVDSSPQHHLQSHQQGDNTPSPRKSMFDFSSPFDALSTAQTTKKRTSPTQPVTASSNDESSSSWTSIQAPDPKRHSFDNLLETMARGQPSHSMAQAPQSSYGPYPSMGDYSHESIAPAARAPLPIPPAGPAKANRAPSPRLSPPPKASVANRQAPRTLESPAGSHNGGGQQTRRDKESSPVPRSGSLRSKAGRNKPRGSPSPQAQSIVFDVSQPLEEIQTSRDAVKSTPIALVKQDSVFLPGTTIGATHWVAYAMTRGRVRVISRSSGDRTLLQLPSNFSPSSSVTDMAVHGNYLAGVTSDGGFVVWQLPQLITDDVPGTLLLNVPPSNSDPLISVKWHPLSDQTLAVASESRLYLIDLTSTHSLGSQPLLQNDLPHISQVFDVPSSLAAFDFDVLNYSLATISRDSTLMLWSIRDRAAYATHKVSGEDTPSSLTFVEGGLVVGRRNGTIFQLLSTSPHSMTVVSNLKFFNGNQDDYDMFGHVNYDSRIRTLWIANSRRNSLIAARIGYDEPTHAESPVAYFEQIVEFFGPKATIHFVILTVEADPEGSEATAACVAAKEPPGDLALVAFSVHSSGVDQVLIRKEWYNSAFSTTLSKFPSSYSSPAPPAPPQIVPESKSQKPLQPAVNNSVPITTQPRTPQSEEVELEIDMPRDDTKMQDGRNKGAKAGKAVGWARDREEPKEKVTKAVEPPASNDGALTQSIAREIKRSEENLHNRLGRLIGKEMDKQNLRLEEARVHDQNEDIARQEKLIKLISTELTKNTTRVVEMAVKNEVQLSVLPSLEAIVKNEIKNTLADHVGRGMADYIGHNLPTEIERVFRRPDTSKHLSQLLSSSFTPIIESTVKDSLTQNFLPMVSQQTSVMHSELLREFRNEMYRMKTDLSGWQNEAFRGQEKIIRNLEHNVQALSDQVKYLSANIPLSSAGSMHHLQSSQSSSSPHSNSGHNQHRQSNVLPSNIPPSSSYPATSVPSTFQGPAPAPPSHSQWYGPTSNIAAPQASHPVTLPQASASQVSEKDRSPPLKGEQWDDIYLSVLHTDDPNKLRDLLSRTNPELVMPMHGTSLVSQAVVLTLIHRLSIMVSEISPTDETFKTYLWWLQRSVNVLNPGDKIITDFIPRVVPNIQKSLNATRQRLSILPVGPLTADTARSIGDVSENLRRKASAV
jgi:hypothetical protein